MNVARILGLVLLISLWSCKKHTSPSTVNSPQKPQPSYLVFAGKYYGTVTYYGYGSDSITHSYQKTNSNVSISIDPKTQEPYLIADGYPLEFTWERGGPYQPFGTKPGSFTFSISGTDTFFSYYYNGRPDNVTMKDFSGKKIH